MDQPIVMASGLDGATGGYLFPPVPASEVARVIQGGEPEDPAHAAELRKARWLATRKDLGPKEGVDPKDLAAAGWGAIFAPDAGPEVREALGELLDHRRAQAAARHERYYREWRGEDAPRPGESKRRFLARHGAGFGPADPENVPYYLLLVGSPETLPYSFQYQLDVEYAVGRICFETPEEYAAYARAVVAAEKGETLLGETAPGETLPGGPTFGAAAPGGTAPGGTAPGGTAPGGTAPGPRATFFGARNPGDDVTAQMADHLVRPLAEKVATDHPDARVTTFVGDDATKDRLAGVLEGVERPDLLFTACHGVAFPNGHPRQLPHQGALVCQDWPGRDAWPWALPEEQYFSAGDVASDLALDGMIGFHFGCYGAGTPRRDSFFQRTRAAAAEIAPHAFIARLPQRLLSRGALAAVSHVDRAWCWSFLWRHGRQLQTFESTLKRLLDGHPVGSAMEYFNRRYAELATALTAELEAIDDGLEPDPAELAALWTAHNDARSFVVFGDPAVRLPAARTAS